MKLSMSVLSVLILITAQTAWATGTATTTSCNDVIAACDKALVAKDIQIKDLGVVVDMQKTQNENLTDIVTRQDAELAAWYRNPLIMALIGGAVAAVILK